MKLLIARIAVVLTSVFVFVMPAGAVRVTPEQAKQAARNWLRKGFGFERRMGTDIESIRSLAGTNGATFHIAAVKGGGFVVLGSDTEDSPVVAVSAQGCGEPDERSPLWALLRQDMAARMLAKAEKRRVLSAAAGSRAATGSSPEGRWARLLEQDDADEPSPTRSRLLSASNGRSTIADVRVNALVKSAWSQNDYGNYGYTTEDDICYNYYTPNHWPCGCVATAGTQVMRYHSYPTSAVVAGTYACSKGGSPVNLTMYGGTYNWDAMTLVPANGCSATSREAIGRLTYDVGVSVGMSYGSGGSSSAGYMLSKRFVDRFQYANAASVVFQDGFFRGGDCSYTLARFKSAVIPNLDEGLPVVLGISGSGGHAVVGDGYGYSDGDFFVHINLGWANLDNGNVWYMPPNIERYTSIDSIVYNVYPTGASGASIVSGRILSTEGLPVEGASVKTVADGVSVSVAASGARGTYALKVSPGTYWVVAEKDGQSASNRVTVSACVSPHLTEDGSYYDDICPQVGNVCDSDLTLDVTGTPEPPPPPENLTWHTTKADAFAAAQTGGKRILLVYGRDACGNTTATRNSTCEDATVKAKLFADYVLWYSDCDTQSAESYRYLRNFSGTLPGVAVIDPELDKGIVGTSGYLDVSGMLELLEAAEEWEAPHPSLASELTEARIRAHDSGKLLFFLNGQACDGNTQFVMDYLDSLGTDFSDSFELYFCDIGSDTTGMAVYAWPVYAAFDPLKFKANWEDGLLAEDMETGAVAEAVQKVLDDALDEYARQMSPDSSDRHLVCYELDGGTNAKSNPASYKADELPLTLSAPTRDSHVFLGWEKDGESVVEIARGTTGHVVLVAKWRPAAADDCVWSYVVENGEAKIYAGWYEPAVTPMPTGDVVIPSELGGCPVTEIGDTAFAFGKMSRLTIPASVRKIGSMVFDRCPNLEIVVDPGNAYFSSEDGVLYNKDKTLLICCPSGKTSVNIPATVVELGESAFDCCEKIEVIDLPQGLKKIGAFAFNECRSLRELILPEGLESIGARSMGNYYGRITELHIPASVTNIDENAWGESIAIVNVTVAGGNPRYEMSDGILYDKLENRALFCERDKAEVSVREGTAAVDPYAFYFCLDLTELTLPSTLARVGYAAFWGCSFADVTIPASLVELDGDAFSYCEDLKDIYFDGAEPDYVGQWIFRGTSEDLKVHVQEGAAGWPTRGQTAEPLRWPAGDAYSREVVFRTDLPAVTYEVVFDLGDYGRCADVSSLTQTVAGCTAATAPEVTYVGPEGMCFAGWDADFSCVTDNLVVHALYYSSTAPWPDGAHTQKVGDRTWSFIVRGGEAKVYCGRYESAVSPKPVGDVVVPAVLGNCPVTEIGDLVFAYCEELTVVTIPASVKRLDSTFWYCQNLKSVYFEGNAPMVLSGESPFNYGVPETMTVYVRHGSWGWSGSETDELPGTWPQDPEDPDASRPIAYWEERPACLNFRVTYELNDGENAESNPTSYTADDLPITLAAPTREGYAFAGWTPNGGVIPEGTTGDLTFVATWSPEGDGETVPVSIMGVGWHEVSFPVLPEGGKPEDVFAPVSDKIGYVTCGSLNWSPAGGGTLKTLEIGKGYWVQTKAENVSWTVTGQGNPDVEIALKPGWNLIGYPLTDEGEVKTVLATALATEKIDWIYSGSRVYPGSLTTLTPGKGYWVYANAAVTIKFDGM